MISLHLSFCSLFSFVGKYECCGKVRWGVRVNEGDGRKVGEYMFSSFSNQAKVQV